MKLTKRIMRNRNNGKKKKQHKYNYFKEVEQ